jgi:hypothetical protein
LWNDKNTKRTHQGICFQYARWVRLGQSGAEAGLGAVEAFESAGIGAEMLTGDGGAGFAAAGLGLCVDLGLLARHLEIHEGGLEGWDAVEAPADGGRLIDEVGPGAALGMVRGCESTGEAGGARAGASLGGDGAAGFGAEGARGIDASLGGHGGSGSTGIAGA